MGLPIDNTLREGQRGILAWLETVATVLNGLADAADGDVATWDAGGGTLVPLTQEELATAVAATTAIQDALDGKQDLSATLTSLAALSTTAFGRSVLEAADADALASTLTAPLSATFAQVKGAGVARFINRAKSGETLVVAALGDSVLEGTTVTNPATDGALILLAADLADRYDTTVTSENFAGSGYTTFRSFAASSVANAIAENADLSYYDRTPGLARSSMATARLAAQVLAA